MITAKQIAKKLGVSEAAVSLALNGKPGVSENLRRKIRETAQELGYDFSKLTYHERRDVMLIIYLKSGAIVTDTPFFDQLFKGIGAECRRQKAHLSTEYITSREDLAALLRVLPRNTGIILLATEMQAEDCKMVSQSSYSHVILDAYYENLESNYVLINNVRGAYIATDYLIRRTNLQPGYLRSYYSITNFEERADGFYKAIRANGMSPSNSVVYRLTPSVEGAYMDMLEILRSGEKIARGYFADNDLIAAGAIRAFKQMGMRIPEDVAIIGFDNVSLCEYLETPLSSINVPKEYMGSQAIIRLLSVMENNDTLYTKIEIDTQLVKRKSC